MKLKKSLFHDVLFIARKKIINHREFKHFLHFSFIIQENKVIEWGTNNKRVPEKHNGYHRRIQDIKYNPKTHSEVDAWKKARGILNKRKNFQIINVRLNRLGELRNSRPCNCCYEILKALGCNSFYFSTILGFQKF